MKPIYSGRRRGRNHDEPEEYEVIDVMEHAKVVADWLLPDDTVPDLVPIPWDEEEVCPRGALDDLVPDEEYFTEATGNEGGSFERTYRRAALVVWPENRRLALVAQAGVGFALPLLSTLPADEARQLAHKVSDIWPSALSRADEGGALRGTYLCALAALGETKLAARFFDTIVLGDGYDGAENEGIVACWMGLDADAVRPRVVALVQEHAAEHPAACADLVDRLASFDAATAVRPVAEALLAHLPRSKADRPWARSVPPDVVARIISAIARIGDVSLPTRGPTLTWVACPCRPCA